MDISPNLLPYVSIIVAWDFVWKAIGLWHAARNNHKFWFVFILFLNTAGILPIIYLKFFQKK